MTLTAGSEIDSWCTRCRLDLGHRIVALVEGKPKRVVCLTCSSEHNYRRPRAQAAAAKPRAKKAATTRKTASRVSEWEERVASAPAGDFVAYRMSATYEEGQLVLHSKFGRGYVSEIAGPKKVTVVFQEGPRTMAQDVS